MHSCSFQSEPKKLSEKEYADKIQKILGGEREHIVEGGRIDLLTEEYAFEIERAHNWKNSIGQALWYSVQTNRKPGIILILENDEDNKYLIRLNSALLHANLSEEFLVQSYPDDFSQK